MRLGRGLAQRDHILLAPPFIITERDSDSIVDILGVVIDEALSGARKA